LSIQGSSEMTFSEAFHADADRLIQRYPIARSALLPLLHLVQSEHGYVTDAGIAFCADKLGLTKAEVGAVATFYTMFKREPVGDYLLSVCTNPTCKVAGAQTIFERFKKSLGGQLTDLETGVTIEQAECLGICDAAPVVQVNYEMYGPLTDEEADRLFDGCRKGNPPVSNWSGEVAPNFREIERELSGANDAFGDHLIEAARHSVASYDVPPAYKTGETDIPVTHPGGDPAGHGGALFRAAFDDVEAARPEVAVPDLPEPQAPSTAETDAPDEVEVDAVDEVVTDETSDTTAGATDSTPAQAAPADTAPDEED
jgi:NADH-quinone oxidoreductase subunit E